MEPGAAPVDDQLSVLDYSGLLVPVVIASFSISAESKPLLSDIRYTDNYDTDLLAHCADRR